MKPVDASPPVVLHTFQGGFGVSSLSPFCLKAEAVLRLAGVPVDRQEPSGPPSTQSGKLPALDPGDGRLIEGSDAIVDWLVDVRGVDLDSGLTPQERAQALAVRRLVEEHLYFHIVQERWVDDAGFAATIPAYFGHLPLVVRSVVSWTLRRSVRASVRGQGVGRMTEARRVRRIDEDLSALSELLGDREWFFGSRPSSIDCVVYAFTANILGQPVSAHLRTALGARPALVAHAERMGALLELSPS